MYNSTKINNKLITTIRCNYKTPISYATFNNNFVGGANQIISGVTSIGAGVGGAIVATLGNILPSFILVTGIATLYTKYKKLNILQSILTALRPAVVAMIATAGITIIAAAFWGEEAIVLPNTNLVAVVLFGLSVFLLIKFKLNPITVIILSGVLNVIWSILTGSV